MAEGSGTVHQGTAEGSGTVHQGNRRSSKGMLVLASATLEGARPHSAAGPGAQQTRGSLAHDVSACENRRPEWLSALVVGCGKVIPSPSGETEEKPQTAEFDAEQSQAVEFQQQQQDDSGMIAFRISF